MASRTAEVKSYVEPRTKSEASDVYARWGMSLSDAVNAFLIKSIEVGGLPFDMRPEPAPRYAASTVLRDEPLGTLTERDRVTLQTALDSADNAGRQ